MRIRLALQVQCALLIGAMLSLCCARADADVMTRPEYALKAAFIYNFALFTTWPDRLDRTITLCVLGPDPFGAALDPLNGKQVGAAKLAVRRMKNRSEAVSGCQIVFVAESELDNYLDAQVAPGVLTIADSKGAAQRGIMIELTAENRKIGFEFNQTKALQASVPVSSKLLRIARRVY
ncbi:MAG: hypothetical protein ACI83P_000802 [Janthinobacterium sp.]|jgi:hypothetical protein